MAKSEELRSGSDLGCARVSKGAETARAIVTTAPVQPPPSRLPATRPAAHRGRGFAACVYSATAIFLALVLALFVELSWKSRLAIETFGLSFLWTSAWNPVTNQFGALTFIYGTVVSSSIAIVLAAVVGILAGAFLAEFGPAWFTTPLSFLIELLAAIPSVVYGLWGLFVLAPVMRDYLEPWLQKYLGFLPFFTGAIYGIGMLTAGVVLAIMIVPTVTAISRDVMAAIPQSQREAIWALGASRWQGFWMVVLPGARAGVFGACALALGRALGETIATTMVIGNRPAISVSWFAPAYSLSSVIANEFTEATSQLYLSALIELGLLLFVISVIVNGLARLLLWTVFRPAED